MSHGMLAEMGIVVISSTLAVGPWWTEAAKAQRSSANPPY
jgi:hypothetical protein